MKIMDFSGTIIDVALELASVGHNEKKYLLI